jgi:lipopolysaccharide transport system permease protein
VAAITPFLPDFRFIVATGMMMLMFASGIFYDYDKVLLEEHKQLFLLNPVARLIDGYREALLHDAWPEWVGLGWILIGSVVVILAMFRFYRRNDALYARLVIQ